MTIRRYLCVVYLIVLMAWLIVILQSASKRPVPINTLECGTIALIVLGCALSGLWGVLLGVVIGGIVGLFLFAAKVNGSGLEDLQCLTAGAVVGAIVGYVCHESRDARPPTPNPDAPPESS